MWGKIKSSSGNHWLLAIILLAAFLIRTINLNYNSPFLDEAIYINLGKLFWEGEWSELAGSISWVGGFPFFYPPISAAFHAIGGIIASRFFNVILGTASVYLIYRLTCALFPVSNKNLARNGGIIAAALMSTSTIPIAYSRQVLYDTLSIFLFLAGSLYLTRAIYEGESKAYLKSAIFLFGAFLAKYIAAIYIPFLLLVTISLAIRTGKKYVIGGIVASFWIPLVLLSLIFVFFNFSSLIHFLSSKTSEHNENALTIIWRFLKYSPLIFAASIPSFYLLIKKKVGGLAAFLAFGSLLPLIVHLLAGESSSVHQHSIFALIFLLPLIGIASSSLIDKYKLVAGAAVAILIFLNFTISVPRVKALETFWPNTDRAVGFLKTRALATDKILAESEDPIVLGLWGKLPADNIEGPFDFTYQNYEGGLAYALATKDGYFNYIETDGTFFEKGVIASIEEAVGKKYALVFDDGSIKIWQRKL